MTASRLRGDIAMSKNMTGGLILLFLATSVFIEATALFALWNTWFKPAMVQLGLWAAGMTLLLWVLIPAWQRFARS